MAMREMTAATPMTMPSRVKPALSLLEPKDENYVPKMVTRFMASAPEAHRLRRCVRPPGPGRRSLGQRPGGAPGPARHRSLPHPERNPPGGKGDISLMRHDYDRQSFLLVKPLENG